MSKFNIKFSQESNIYKKHDTKSFFIVKTFQCIWEKNKSKKKNKKRVKKVLLLI